jgi:small-conductance mechanosensitive channel
MNTLLAVSLNWDDIFTEERIVTMVGVATLLLIGIPALIIATVVATRATRRRLSPQRAMIVRKIVLYGGSALLLLTLLSQAGIQLTALLGAAGIVGIAIGFASQTSVSQVISGLFLIGEKPFEVGDIIRVGDQTGTVLSIDLLSVKMRTFDNQFVRIPNESLIRNVVTNITRFPLRRLDIKLGVAYKEDVPRVRDVLKRIARDNPFCLDEPEPIIIFTDFGDSSLNFLFAVWCVKADFLQLRNSIMDDIKRVFDEEEIEIPFPHRTLYTGSITDPMPIRIVSGDGAGGGSPEAQDSPVRAMPGDSGANDGAGEKSGGESQRI